MSRRPLIVIAPGIEKRGEEFGDLSTSLSRAYQAAVEGAGAVPMVLPPTVCGDVVAECVQRCDGILLTGGEDVDPRLYSNGLAPMLRRTVTVTPDGGERDLRECLLIDEVFRQRKPLMAICRGHQMLNVALGGTLVADIRREIPRAINHRRMDQRNEVVHEVRLTADSILAKITGAQTLGVNSTHHQAIGCVAAPLRVTAVSADGVIEGLELKRGGVYQLPFLLSVQFHPERLLARHREHREIFRVFVQACVRSRQKTL